MDRFGKEFQKRLLSVLPHGEKQNLAKKLHVSTKTVGRWCDKVEENWRFPDIFEAIGIAEFGKVSPAWLAFGIGPQAAKEALAGFELGEQLQANEGLKDIVAAYVKADANTRAAMLTLLHPQGLFMQAPQKREPIPAGTVVQKLAPGHKVYVSPSGKNETKTGEAIASEAPAIYTRPVVKSIKPVNRRADYSVYSIKRKGPADPEGLPSWFNLAAGPGGYLERSEDLWIIPKLSRAHGINLAIVRGDSMIETLKPGDMILLQNLNGGDGVRLPSLEPGQQKTPVENFKRAVENDHIYALSLDNGQTVTIKRVTYQIAKGGRWHIIIEADNRAEFKPYLVREEDEVIFYAKMIGFGKE